MKVLKKYQWLQVQKRFKKDEMNEKKCLVIALTTFVLRVRHEGLLHRLRRHHFIFLFNTDRGCCSNIRFGYNFQFLHDADVPQFVCNTQSCLPTLQKHKLICIKRRCVLTLTLVMALGFALFFNNKLMTSTWPCCAA